MLSQPHRCHQNQEEKVKGVAEAGFETILALGKQLSQPSETTNPREPETVRPHKYGCGVHVSTVPARPQPPPEGDVLQRCSSGSKNG